MVIVNLIMGFWWAWMNLMNLFDYDIPNMTGQNYLSGGV